MKNQIIGILSLNKYFENVRAHFPENMQLFSLDNYQAHLDNIQGIVTTPGGTVDETVMNSLPQLKIVACFGVGVDAIDVSYATKKGVLVTNTPDVVTDDTADVALALLLCASRNIVANDRFVRSGKWNTASAGLSTAITGKTIGIVGLGKIGKSIAARAIPFGMKVCYHGRHKQDVAYPYYENLVEMAKISDYLVVSSPGGEGTKNIINSDVIHALGAKGFLINISRGSNIDEQALLHALENNLIKGAGLDVFYNEPRIDERFLKLDNVILQPHIGTATHETRLNMLNLVIANLEAFFKNGKGLTPVN